jgi:glycosyltransferase involved in cell wall biosynthesis
MLISICIPIYNVEQYVEHCARSLFEQTFSNIEYIFVDDCTKDRSLAILSEVIRDYPDKVSAIKMISHERNRGLAAARNTAIENCSGDFVMHVDSDDYLEKNAVELLVKKQIETNADIVSGCALKETKEGKQLMREPDYKDKDEMLLKVIKANLDHVIWRRLIRLSLYKKHHIACEEGVNVGEDIQVLPKLVYYSQKVTRIDDIIYHYNCLNEESYMSQKERQYKFSIADQDIRSIEIVEEFLRDKGEQYVATIKKSKVSLLISWLTPAYISKDWKAYNFLAGKLLAIDKPYLVSIGWDKFKVRFVNRNYLNRWIYDVINSIIRK